MVYRNTGNHSKYYRICAPNGCNNGSYWIIDQELIIHSLTAARLGMTKVLGMLHYAHALKILYVKSYRRGMEYKIMPVFFLEKYTNKLFKLRAV